MKFNTIQSELTFLKRRSHALKRVAERYGVQLDQNEYAYLNNKIRDGKCCRIKTLHAHRAIYRISYKGKELYAVYSHHHHKIITFLTLEQISNRKEPSP